MFREASRFVSDISAQGKTVLFVGTKRQAQEAIVKRPSAAMRTLSITLAGRHADHWSTLQKSIKRLKLLKAMTEDGAWSSSPRKSTRVWTAK